MEILEDEMVTLDFSLSTDPNTTASSPLTFSTVPVNPGPGFNGYLNDNYNDNGVLVTYEHLDHYYTHKNGNLVHEDHIDAFYVTATDNDGNTSTITIEVHVEEVNDIPDWSFMPSPTPEDNAVNYNDIISGTVTIIEEADGIADGAAFTPNTLPSIGTLRMGETANQQNQSATVNWTYTPHENYHGSDSFVLQIVDGSGNTQTSPPIVIEVGCDANFYNHDENASTDCIPCTTQTDCEAGEVLTGDCTQTTSPTCEVPSRFTTSGEIVTDSSTNLMWTKCEHGKSYSSEDNSCTTMTGTDGTLEWCTAGRMCKDDTNAYDLLVSSTRSQALAACTNSTLGGYTDWRLPTVHELKTLISCSSTSTGNVAVGAGCVDAVSSPTINEAIFPDTNDEKFWTANHDSENNLAYYVNFVDGSDGVADTHASKLRVRCVRGDYMDGVCGNDFYEPGEDCDDSNDDNYDDCTEQCLSRFLGYGANSVTDHATELIWQRCESGKTFYATQADCVAAVETISNGDEQMDLNNFCYNGSTSFPACYGDPVDPKCTAGDSCEDDVNTTNNL